MRRRRIIFRILLGALLIYLVSYISISLGGHYEPRVYGLIQGPDETHIVAPKPVFGYEWNPFRWSHFEPPAEGAVLPKIALIYLPLACLDQKVWHTNKTMEQLESEDYRVKHFFDFKERVYRDIEP